MAEQLKLPAGDMALAGAALGTAAQGMAEDTADQPSSSLKGLSNVEAEVDEYLRSLSLARNALADSAKTASRAVSSLMDDSAELDAFLAQVLYAGYAVGRNEP